MFKKIGNRQKLSQRIVHQFIEMIRNKEIKPGEQLPTEKELCEYFDVSRAPIREAMNKLEAKGLIVVKKGKGTYVNNFDLDMAISPINLFFDLHFDVEYSFYIIEMLKIIGPSIAKKAALNRTEENIKNMENYVDEFELLRKNDSERAKKLEEKFQNEIVLAAHNPVGILILKPIFKLVPEIRSLFSKNFEVYRDRTLKYNRSMLAAIKSKLQDAAYNRMKEYIEMTEEYSSETMNTIS